MTPIQQIEMKTRLDFAEFGIDQIVKSLKDNFELAKSFEQDTRQIGSVLELAIDIRKRLSTMPGGRNEQD